MMQVDERCTLNLGQIIDDKGPGSATLRLGDSGRGHCHKEVAVDEVDCQADTVLGYKVGIHQMGEVARKDPEDPRMLAVEVVGFLGHTHLAVANQAVVVDDTRAPSALALVVWFLDCPRYLDNLTSDKLKNVVD